MEIWIVEHRVLAGKKELTWEIAHIGSSFEKAIEWCKNNLNYDSKREKSPWWFYIAKMNVDNNELMDDVESPVLLSWDGEVLKEVPSSAISEEPKIIVPKDDEKQRVVWAGEDYD
jgi:hypothetical protein